MDSVSNNGFFPSVALARSMPVNFRLCSSAPEVRGFIRSIVEAAGDDPPSRAVVCLLVLNFLRLRYSDPRRLLAISSDRNFYTGRSPTYNDMVRARKALERIGYVAKVAPGIKYRDTGKGFTGRWRGTARLIEAAAKAGIRSTMIHSKGPEFLIKLRPPKKKPVRKKKVTTYSEGKSKRDRLCHWPHEFRLEKKQMEENLQTINQALSKCFIALNVSDDDLERMQSEELEKKREEVKFIDFFDKSVFRVFNDCDPHLGGRFYGGFWQAVPRKYRERIWMAAPGKYPAPTIELDYSEMQPRMLYALAGVPVETSPYEICDDAGLNKITRDVVKSMFLPMMNAASKRAALKAAQKSIVDTYDTEWIAEHPGEKRPSMTIDEMLPEGCPPLSVLIDAIEARHSQIRMKFYDPMIGKQLMFLDSQIAEAVMLRMIKSANSVALPIHDSFIVRKGYDIDLRRYMEEEFYKRFKAPIGIKQPGRDLGRWPGDGRTDSPTMVDVLDTADLLGPGEPTASVYGTLLDDWNRAHKVG
jgi:hypothetical protein